MVKMTWSHPKMPFPQRVRLLLGSLSPSKFGDEISSFADPGCLSQIPDPESEFFPSQIPDSGSKFFPSWIQIFSIPDPGSQIRIKEFKYFNQKNGFSALRNMIRVFHPGSGSRIWILTFYPSRILILYPRSRIQGSKRHRSPDPGSGFATLGFWLCSGCRGYRWLLTFNGRCCLNNSFNGSAFRSFYVQKRILRIFYFNIISLIFTVFKLSCPAHLFPNTPRTVWY
jgi:hypothetical protein